MQSSTKAAPTISTIISERSKREAEAMQRHGMRKAGTVQDWIDGKLSGGACYIYLDGLGQRFAEFDTLTPDMMASGGRGLDRSSYAVHSGTAVFAKLPTDEELARWEEAANASRDRLRDIDGI